MIGVSADYPKKVSMWLYACEAGSVSASSKLVVELHGPVVLLHTRCACSALHSAEGAST